MTDPSSGAASQAPAGVDIEIRVPRASASKLPQDLLDDLRRLADDLANTTGIQSHASCQKVEISDCVVFMSCQGFSTL